MKDTEDLDGDLFKGMNNKNTSLETIKCEQIIPISSHVDWQTLPHEIWLQVLSYLKHSDLIQFARSCKLFSNIYLDNTLCKLLEFSFILVSFAQCYIF